MCVQLPLKVQSKSYAAFETRDHSKQKSDLQYQSLSQLKAQSSCSQSGYQLHRQTINFMTQVPQHDGLLPNIQVDQ